MKICERCALNSTPNKLCEPCKAVERKMDDDVAQFYLVSKREIVEPYRPTVRDWSVRLVAYLRKLRLSNFVVIEVKD